MAKLKDQMLEDEYTGKNSFAPRTEPQQVQDWFRNKREELGITRHHFTDRELSPNPFDRND